MSYHTQTYPNGHWHGHHCCGLYPIYGGSPDLFPLVNTTVHYDLIDVQALASIVQTFTSSASDALEVKYVFPLPPDASICAFKAVINGERTIKGIVKAKATAKAEYDQAVSKGKTAALLEQSNVEIFQLSLGNIKPEQTIEIHISFATVISHNGELDSLRLTFPSVIAPRYGVAPNAILNYTTNTWPWRHTLRRTYRDALDFSISVQMTSHIKSITSPSHPIDMKLGQSTAEDSADFDPFKAHIALASPMLLDKDIIIALNCVGLDKPRCMVEAYSPEEGAQEYTDAYALTLVPRFELPALPAQEYIFLVDRSGSMGGGKMTAVQSALQIMLRSLPPRGTSFNIISFGSRHSSLFRSSAPYSADSVKKASSHVDTMRADHGGTEIRAALEEAFKSRSSPSTPASVFVLTDGEAYDLDGVQACVAAAVAKSKVAKVLLRLFCLGIGNSVSKAMCDMIARTGLGSAMYVAEQEKPDQKLMALLRAARGAPVEEISVDWGIPEVDSADDKKESPDDDFELVNEKDAPPVYHSEAAPPPPPPISLFDEAAVPDVKAEKASLGPDASAVKLPPPPRIQVAPSPKLLPPLYPGFRTSVFAIIKRNNKNSLPSKSVRITGHVMGQPVHLDIAVTTAMQSREPSAGRVKMLHVLAARALVQHFEDDGKGTFMDAVHKAEILRVAERYQITSSETSFVAVDEDKKPVDYGVTEERDVYEEVGAALNYMQTNVQMSLSSASPPPGASPRPAGIGGMMARMRPLAASPPSLSRRMVPLGGSGAFGSAAPGGRGGGGPMVRASSMASSAPMAPPPPPAAPSSRPRPIVSEYASLLEDSSPRSHTDLLDLSDDGDVQKEKKPTASKKGGSGIFGGFSMKSVSPKAEEAVAPKADSSIESFAREQSFDGFFIPSKNLYQVLVKSSTAPNIPAVLVKKDKDAETIWCTMLCIAYLELKFANEKDVWDFMVEKALVWMEEALGTLVGAGNVDKTKATLKEEAKKCVKV